MKDGFLLRRNENSIFWKAQTPTDKTGPDYKVRAGFVAPLRGRGLFHSSRWMLYQSMLRVRYMITARISSSPTLPSSSA